MRIERRGTRLVADIIVKTPSGDRIRERANVPKEVTSPSGAKRWAEARALHLAVNGRTVAPAPEAPAFRDFGKRWLREYARAEGLKPSTIDTYDMHLRLHLYPVLGAVRIDAIQEPEIQRVKLHLEGKSAKTRVGILSQLASMLKTAERWGEIDRAPHIDLPRVFQTEMEFYDFDEWERLIEGARKAGPMVLTALLLAGDAGVRRGELVALLQTDCGVDAVTISRNEWKGRVGVPKGGQSRRVPMTARLAAAVAAVRHLRGARLLWQANGKAVKLTTLQSWLEVATKRAGLPESRDIHKLRHTFCSHLALRGVPVMTIKELAGHADLKTTMRYMHLAKGSKEAAIAMLENGAGVEQTKSKGKT